MKQSKRYSSEVRERAVRLVFEHQAEYASQWAEWKAGTPVTVLCTFSDDRLRAYQVILANFQETEWIMRVSGEISVHTKGYSHVKGVYVPPLLARSFEHGNEVSVVAVRKFNKKRNKSGWTAIARADDDVVVKFEKYLSHG